jgi:predicted RNase H-like HicB family nuclease
MTVANPNPGIAMKYKVSLRKSEEGFSVSCPGLPGCWSEGKTEEEALKNIADAIAEYLAVAAKLAIEDSGEVREVEVAA